jgi:hypothetical protein
MPSSRASRKRAAIVPLDGEPGVAQVRADNVFAGWGGWGQGWNGADFSPDRGYVYWPQDDTRRDLPSFSLYEMRRRSRYLDANVGFVGRINRGIARMVAGTGLMVRPTTKSKEWNRDRMATLSAAQRFGRRGRRRAEVEFLLDASGHARDAEYRWRYGHRFHGVFRWAGAPRLCRSSPHRQRPAERGEMRNIFDGVTVDR